MKMSEKMELISQFLFASLHMLHGAKQEEVYTYL